MNKGVGHLMAQPYLFIIKKTHKAYYRYNLC